MSSTGRNAVSPANRLREPSSGSEPRFFFGWYLPAAAFVLGICSGLFLIYGFGTYLPGILEETGWGRAEAAGVFGIVGAEIGLLAPIYGALIDRFGPRKLLVFGSLLGGLGFMIFASSTSLATYYLGFILAGVGLGGYWFAPLAAIVNWFQKNRALCLGIALSGTGLSALLLPVLQGAVEIYGWRDAVMGTGIIVFLVCVPLSFVFRSAPEPYGYTVDGLPIEPDYSDAVDADRSLPLSVTAYTLDLVRHRLFWVLVWCWAVATLGLASLLPHLITFYDEVGIRPSTASLAFSFYAIVSLIARIGFGALGDRYDQRTLMLASLVCMSLGIIATGFTSATWHLLFFVLLIGAGFSGVVVLVPALTSVIFGKRAFPVAFAIVSVPAAILTLGGPAAVGWMYDTMGSYQPAFLAFGIVALLAAPLLGMGSSEEVSTMPTRLD